MSTSRDSCCLPSVKKQKHDFQVFAFVQCIIKQLLDSVFVISRIIKVSVRVISLSLRLRLITLTSTLIILDITKTSSNNCLLSYHSQSSGPVHSLPVIHGKAGVSFLCLHNNTMYSAGRDGVYRQLRIHDNTLEVIDTKKVLLNHRMTRILPAHCYIHKR